VLADVEAVAREMRARGLRVHLETAGGAAGQAAASAGAQTPAPQIPAAVAGALVHATREALANVATHAGTGEAWVSVTLAAGALRVTVRDTGAGFDPARVDPARLGLRRSITERLTDRGGRASVRSAPGQGTLVSLSWPGTVPAAGADLVAAESSW
jgi:signal transduction histidine kinase